MSKPSGSESALLFRDMARLCGLQTDNLDSWRQSRILIMRHDEHGQLLRVISVDPGVALSMTAEAAAAPGG